MSIARMNRANILEQIQRRVHAGQSIRLDIAHVDTNHGLHFANNADLAFVYHTSDLPNANQIAALLPVADANGAVLKLAKKGLPKDKPAIAGICGNDPFRLLDKLLAEIKTAGFVGVQNFPTCGFMDGSFRQHLEASDLGYAREVEVILAARSIDLLTMPLVFSLEDALQMLEAGADILIFHPGAKAFRKKLDLNEFSKEVTTLTKKIKSARRDALILRYNGHQELVTS